MKDIELDKVLHFLACYFIASITHYLSNDVVFSVITAIAWASIKEFMDDREKGNKWSWGDLLADGIGVLAFLAALGVHRIIY